MPVTSSPRAPSSSPTSEIEGRHVLGLDDSMHEGEIVQEYSAKIISWDGDDYDGGSAAGNAQFYIVKAGAAMNCGVSLMDAIDSIDQDVYEYGAAVLDPDTDDLRADLVERFECIGGDLMFLHLMKILPAHRGRDIGLVAASRLIESYANGLVVCRPQPLQHVGDEPERFANDSMEYERFSKDRREAKQSSRGTGLAWALSLSATMASTHWERRKCCRP